MEFPTIENWRKILVPGDEKFGKPEFYEYYKTKYEIAKRFHPEHIAEIGVRWGYSAYAFLCACPVSSYSGFDMISGGHGGVKDDTFDYVKQLLENSFSESLIKLFHIDTRKLDILGTGFDFIHIDGNHTESGAYHDMEISFKSLNSGGVLLVDDFTYIAGVARAVRQFVKDYNSYIKSTEEIESIRGEYIIIKN